MIFLGRGLGRVFGGALRRGRGPIRNCFFPAFLVSLILLRLTSRSEARREDGIFEEWNKGDAAKRDVTGLHGALSPWP